VNGGCFSDGDVVGQTAATSTGASGCLTRGDGRAPVREVHRVTFAEDRNKYLNADDQLCDGLDFELELGLAGHRASDDDDVELIPRHSIIKLPRPPRYLLSYNERRNCGSEVEGVIEKSELVKKSKVTRNVLDCDQSSARGIKIPQYLALSVRQYGKVN